MENLVLMEAKAEVTGIMRDGSKQLFSERTGKIEEVAFAALDRQGRVDLLESGVDWNLYMDMGMEPEEAERIVENAADGKPQSRWLEPLVREDERAAQHDAAIAEAISGLRETFGPSQSGLTFTELLESYAGLEPDRVEIEHGRDR